MKIFKQFFNKEEDTKTPTEETIEKTVEKPVEISDDKKIPTTNKKGAK